MQSDKEIIDSDRCNDCLYFSGGNVCLAFPIKIPDEILHGDNLHNEPLDGQVNDIVFKKFNLNID